MKKGKKIKNSSPSIRSHDIKCFKCLGLGHTAFQCPNKKVMIVHESVEEVVSENELDPEEEVEKVQVIPLEEGELLVIHSNLSIQSKKEEE